MRTPLILGLSAAVVGGLVITAPAQADSGFTYMEAANSGVALKVLATSGDIVNGVQWPGTPDGIVGAGTRTALRAWQKAKGIVADGYLSPAMVQQLKAEAGVS